jgi:enoyl-[acyl-carrier protein] reductase III
MVETADKKAHERGASRIGSDSLPGRVSVVTGGTQGLGLAVALRLAAQGQRVLVGYRSNRAQAEEALSRLRALEPSCALIEADLSQLEGVEKFWGQVEQQTKHLDHYVHNAAATAFAPLLSLKSHQMDRTFQLTLKSFLLGLQRAVPLFEAAGGGSVVTVSGMDTLRAVPLHGLLGAAKSALETLTQYAAHELAPRGIRVNGVNPGFLKTASTQKYLGPAFEEISRAYARTTPLGRDAELAEVAAVIEFLLSPASAWIVGQTLTVDGGFQDALGMQTFFNLQPKPPSS